MILLIAGGRDYDDANAVREALSPYNQVGNVLMTGAERGTDSLAEKIWREEFQLPYVGVPARWNASGRAAGPARNLVMVKGLALAPHATVMPDEMVAFPGGRGTSHCVRAAEKQGIAVVWR